jgi:integrase
VVEELIERSPADGIPRSAQRKGIALKPEQVQLLARSFADEQARVAFLTFVLTGVRRSELQALRWRDVDLIENVLRVADSKTETGLRAIALTPGLHEELWQHRRRSAFKATTSASSAIRSGARSTATRRTRTRSSRRSRRPGWNGRKG